MTGKVAVLASSSVLLAGIAVGYLSWPSQVSAREDLDQVGKAKSLSLGMHVERRGSDLNVQWNGASPLLAEGARGVVFIRDGAQHTESHLEYAHLATGQLVYMPQTDDVDVRLEVITADHVVRESVRVIAPGRIASAAAAPVHAGGAPLAAKSAIYTSAPALPARMFVAPTPRMTTAQSPTPAAAPPAAQKQAVAAKAPAPAPSGTPASPAPAAHSPQVTIPEVVQKAPVVVPAHLRAEIHRHVDVRLALHIDEEGRVLSARPLDADTTLKAQLAVAAVAAAREYRFTAARLNGQPVSSNHELTFRFRR